MSVCRPGPNPDVLAQHDARPQPHRLGDLEETTVRLQSQLIEVATATSRTLSCSLQHRFSSGFGVYSFTILIVISGWMVPLGKVLCHLSFYLAYAPEADSLYLITSLNRIDTAVSCCPLAFIGEWDLEWCAGSARCITPHVFLISIPHAGA